MGFDGRRVPLMNIEGQQQTCYADWSRAVLSFYPHNPRFAKNGEIVEVWQGDQKVAEFDFSTGKGQIISGQMKNLEEVGKEPNFARFDLDSMLQMG